ncbi:ATP-binding protein [Massilia solisilvae]|uniref:ATP-binding protein n=1 Tax=Massilia solisilvae TaxID=1811225 RepID=A0ABT2BHJ9_9BURK|nr:ATP-binding protein [Massilia solisilvae]MCS0607368.1 ATP-binding protein [Massilia solisilvae]
MAERDAAAEMVEKVVFVGAESTGKSTLAQYLAHEFDTVYVPEIGRFIWEEKKGQLNVDDYVDIAVKHRQAEAEGAARARRYLFVDTSALTTLLLGYCFGHIKQAPEELLRYADDCKLRYAHHFVCADDIPYEYDPARENEAWRGRIQKLVLDDLDARGIAYTVVTGTVEERAAQVRRVLEAR